jgi:26S proteasome regulatory subunit N12
MLILQTNLITSLICHCYYCITLAGEILEIGAFTSLRSHDIPSFDRYFSQLLGTFYTDYRSRLSPSAAEFPLRGLHLVRLLTQNRIADFHATLESLPLPKEEIAKNPYISHPVNLDRWMLEGSYSKVWNAREEAPTQEYKFFVDSLMGTIRYTISYFFFTMVVNCLSRVTEMKSRAVKRQRMLACH